MIKDNKVINNIKRIKRKLIIKCRILSNIIISKILKKSNKSEKILNIYLEKVIKNFLKQDLMFQKKILLMIIFGLFMIISLLLNILLKGSIFLGILFVIIFLIFMYLIIRLDKVDKIDKNFFNKNKK